METLPCEHAPHEGARAPEVAPPGGWIRERRSFHVAVREQRGFGPMPGGPYGRDHEFTGFNEIASGADA